MKKIFLLLLIFFTTESFATGIGNVATAPCDNDTLSKYTGTANVEINWEPNTIGLNWYNGDEKLTVANSAQSCVYDGTITVPPAPTKLGYTFNGWKVIPVPGGFTELEYLTSSGTQYIDTSIYFDITKNLQIVGNLINPSGVYRKIIIGNYQNYPVFNVELGGGGGDYPPAHFRNWVSSGPKTANQWADFALPLNTLITYDTYYNATNRRITNNLTANGLTTTYSVDAVDGTGVSSVPLRFFRDYRYTGETSYPLSIGVTKIYQNGNLVGDFVPARRNSDNVLGFYDRVTNTFLTNGGTGTFTAGPVVQ